MAFLFNQFSSAKKVEVRKALGEGKMSELYKAQDGTEFQLEIIDVVAFSKNPEKRNSELSDHDCSLALTQRVRDAKTGSTVDIQKLSGAISARLWEKLANGQDLVKVPFKETYKRQDIKGSPANLQKLRDLDARLYMFDAWVEDKENPEDSHYPEDEDGNPIFENLIVGLPEEFELEPDQPRHKDDKPSGKKVNDDAA